MSPVFRSLNEVVTKVATFFILWFFVVWGHLFKPRFKPTLAMNASISVVCYKSKTLSNGEYPLMFRISKDDLCKKWKRIINRNLLKKNHRDGCREILEIRVCSVEYSFRHRLHSFQQPCPCQREIDRGTDRNTDRYHTEYRTQSLVYPMARLQDCRCGMGYGHRLYGSNAYYVILLTGKDSHLTISIALSLIHI